jgi:hypothetical protein
MAGLSLCFRNFFAVFCRLIHKRIAKTRRSYLGVSRLMFKGHGVESLADTLLHVDQLRITILSDHLEMKPFACAVIWQL